MCIGEIHVGVRGKKVMSHVPWQLKCSEGDRIWKAENVFSIMVSIREQTKRLMKSFKGTNCEITHVKYNFKLGLKCQAIVIFGIMKDYSKHHYLFHMQNLFQNGASDISEMVNVICMLFVKNIKILCSSDHPILFKFCQVVVKIVRNYK